MKYHVRNIYGISIDISAFDSPEKALKKRDSMAGDGWTVIDDEQFVWDYDNKNKTTKELKTMNNEQTKKGILRERLLMLKTREKF